MTDAGWARVGVAGGLIAPPLFVAATATVTLVDRPFVERSEWSAVHRSEVGWPSVVTLGPNGAVVIAAFVVCGVLIIGLASALWALVPDAPLLRLAAALLAIAGLALCLVAFRQDPLGFEGAASWHDRIHNAAYPVIPVCGSGAAALVWAGGRRRPGWGGMARISLLTVAVAAPAFVLTAAGAARAARRGPTAVRRPAPRRGDGRATRCG